jgi:DNA-binding Lrp family transcriptional regulator
MGNPIDKLTARLLDVLQVEVPLVGRPFAAVAEALGADEDDVLARVREMRSAPKPAIRQISAIFDSKALGYQSTLVAAKVPEAALEGAAAVVGDHPGVSHNYRREHDYNLWYTLAIPADSRFGLQQTAHLLHRLSGATATRLLPTLRLFKIGVRFDFGGEGEPAPSATSSGGAPGFTQDVQDRATALPLSESDKRMIRVLQQDLPIEPRPFDRWAEQAGVTVDELLAAARQFRAEGRMRRFSAVLRHREVGFSANAMGVWAVPAERQEPFGRIAAGFSAVSHCYLRPTYPDWPYSIFTMVHGTSREACEGVLSAISGASGVTQYAALYSTKEYKKSRVRYFTGETEAWEKAHLPEARLRG